MMQYVAAPRIRFLKGKEITFVHCPKTDRFIHSQQDKAISNSSYQKEKQPANGVKDNN